jgi:putative cardiolipin synthase
MVDSKELAKQTIELFDRSTSPDNSYRLQLDEKSNRLSWLTRKAGGETRYSTEPEAGLMRKLGVEIMSLLPIESLL